MVHQFEDAMQPLDRVECWSARDLQFLLGYSKWENFEKVINKAKEACKNAGGESSDHFPDVRKMIQAGKGAQQEISDIDRSPIFSQPSASRRKISPLR